jgi:hypothetical protein
VDQLAEPVWLAGEEPVEMVFGQRQRHGDRPGELKADGAQQLTSPRWRGPRPLRVKRTASIRPRRSAATAGTTSPASAARSSSSQVTLVHPAAHPPQHGFGTVAPGHPDSIEHAQQLAVAALLEQ